MSRKFKLSLILFLFSLGIIFPSKIFAQDSLVLKFNYPQKIHSIIKFNPIPILWGPLLYTGEYRLLSEFTTSKRQSTQIGVGFLGKSLIYKLFEDSLGIFGNQKTIIRGFRIQASHRFFSSRKTYSPQGFYFSPHVSYAYAKLTTPYLLAHRIYIGESNFNINFLVGVQFFIARTVSVDFFGGFGYKNLKFWQQFQDSPRIYFDPFDGQKSLYNSHFKFNLGLNFGIVTKKIKSSTK